MTGKQSHRKVLILGGVAAIIMFGFCFAIVPFYNLICQKTGINVAARNPMLISPSESKALSLASDATRTIEIQFTATNHMGMPWDFYPRTKSMTVHPGEKKTVYFYAKNTTSHDMTAQAIPSMTPPESIGHFHKIECFCFRQQTLKAGESKEMALVFQVDNQLPKEDHVITLSYTLFDATPKSIKKG